MAVKVFAYSLRDFDEREIFFKTAEKYSIEVGYSREKPMPENAHLAKGYDCISVLTTPVRGELMREFHKNGVKMISARTIGYDHIDIALAKELGISVSNVSYSTESVADFTVMLMLMALKNAKRMIQRADINDFTLRGLIGRELHDMTVGIIGTGSIGRVVMRDLQGFGCKILCCDHHVREEAARMGEYVSFERLLRESDIISLHVPLKHGAGYLLSQAEFAKMKRGAIIVNTARGGLIDSGALIAALESGHIAAAALDVVEDEFGIYYYDRKADCIGNHSLAVLRDMPNTIITPHMAFYTRDAVRDMVENSLLSCKWEMEGSPNKFKIV